MTTLATPDRTDDPGAAPSGPHQVLDQSLQLLLCLPDGILLPYDGDQVLILVLGRGEYDAGSSAVTHLADFAAPFANEELVVFWLGADVNSETLGLLWKPTADTLV